MIKKQANFSAHFPAEIRDKIKQLRAKNTHLSSNQAVVIDCIMLAYALMQVEQEAKNAK